MKNAYFAKRVVCFEDDGSPIKTPDKLPWSIEGEVRVGAYFGKVEEKADGPERFAYCVGKAHAGAPVIIVAGVVDCIEHAACEVERAILADMFVDRRATVGEIIRRWIALLDPSGLLGLIKREPGCRTRTITLDEQFQLDVWNSMMRPWYEGEGGASEGDDQ